MPTTDPNAAANPAHQEIASRGEPPQHEPRVPGGRSDEAGYRQDHPKKPFRTPSKNKTHAAPETGTDGDPGLRNRQKN